MASKKSDSKDVMSLLESLEKEGPPDEFSEVPANPVITSSQTNSNIQATNEDEANVLAFLDEISRQPPSKQSRPQSRANNPSVGTGKIGTGSYVSSGHSSIPNNPISSHQTINTSANTKESMGSKIAEKGVLLSEEKEKCLEEEKERGDDGGGGWFSSFVNTASATLRSAEARVRELQTSDDAKRWEGLVRENVSAWGKFGEELKKVGERGLENVLNTIAPPIAQHEVLQVNIYHDMIAYNNVETIVYAVFERVGYYFILFYCF